VRPWSEVVAGIAVGVVLAFIAFWAILGPVG
jgi:hypothetical protein